MLKDDKSYPFIKVTVNEEYPRVLFARRMKKDKAKYFGPYTSAGAVKDVIELVRKLYKVRSCNRVLPRDCGKDRPCLYHHMKQCSAPCQGYVSSEEYKKNIAELLKFLNGDFKDTIDKLTDKMMEASEEMRFEDAMEYRDLIRSIQKIGERQKITGYGVIFLIVCTSHTPWNLRLCIVMIVLIFQKNSFCWKLSCRYTGTSPVCQS